MPLIAFCFVCLITLGALVSQTAHAADKSPLVCSLERIFYDPSFASIPDRQFNVADFGATPDDESVDTEAIQRALDAAEAAGGGTVTFPKGTYRSGALFVKSNTNLRLDQDVVIQAVQDNAAYPERWTRIAGIEMMWPSALINVYGQRNVRITGPGVIDGNGEYWWRKFWGEDQQGGMMQDYIKRGLRWAVDYDCKRVRAVVVWKSSDVLLTGFTVKRSGFWTVSLTYSQRVHVDGVIVRNNIGGYGPSSDGVDTDSSCDVLVENCDIDCNDDNLCIKSGRDADGLRVNRPAENIVYRDCVTRAGHGMFTLGSETSGGIRNVEVYNLSAVGTHTGIRFKSARTRGGRVEKIDIHDIKMERVALPFEFNLDWYPEYSYATLPAGVSQDQIPDHWKVLTARVEPPERGIPHFSDIDLHDITVADAGTAIWANGYKEKPMQDFRWRDIQIQAGEPGEVRHAKHWTMRNVSLHVSSEKEFITEDCTGVELPTPVYVPQTPDPEH